VPAKGLEPLTP